LYIYGNDQWIMSQIRNYNYNLVLKYIEYRIDGLFEIMNLDWAKNGKFHHS
jgi:hypothetical protein